MTNQIQSSPVGAPDSSSENALAQWQELPLFLFRKRIKSLALLRYGDTSVRLSSPAVDYILSAQYSPTRHTSDGISPAVIIEESEMTYTAEPTSVPEPQRAVWEILAKSPSYEMRKTAAGRGLKVETFIELLSDRAFSVRETVLDNIDGLETLASTEGGRKALALALKDRTLRNTVRHRIRDIDEQAAAVIWPLLIRAVTEGDAVDGEPTPIELVLNPDTDPFTVVLTEPDALEATIDCLLDDDDFDDSYGKCVSGSFVVNADTSHIIENLPQTLVNPFACSPPITPVLPHPRCASLRLMSVRQFVVASLLNRRALPMKSESPSMEMIRSASSNTSTASRSFRQRPTLSAQCSPIPILRSFCTPREKSKT